VLCGGGIKEQPTTGQTQELPNIEYIWRFDYRHF